MEILFISHKHPPGIGGMEKQSFELVEGMRQYVKVHTIIHQPGQSKAAFFAGLNKHIVAMCRQHPGISIIHYNDGLMAAFCIKHKGYEHLKRTVTLHGLDVVFPLSVYQQKVLPAFGNFAAVFAVSRATAQACIDRGIPAEKIKVISNGVDVAIAGIVPRPDLPTYLAAQYNLHIEGRRVLVCMGRAVKRKGFSWFIKHVVPGLADNTLLLIIGPYKTKPAITERIIQLLPPRLAALITLFLGISADEQEIRTLLAQPRIGKKVRHMGKLPFDDILQLLMAADAFVMPNIAVDGDIEGFGLVALEACLCGTRVFASRTDGITDVITEGSNGYFLPPGDTAAWLNALKQLNAGEIYALKPEEIKAYTLQHFGWDKMVREYLQCFKELMSSREKVILHE